jgi:uncharacterized membrane protein YhaH (DUF805 family)
MELFLSPDGRIGRGKFWLGLLGIIAVNIVLGLVLVLSGLMSVDPVTGMPMGAGYWIGTLIMMAVAIWPSICIYGKRFHDRDKSAWWILIGLVPIIGGIWLLVECGLLQGTDGPNRFGPDPVAEG